MTKPEIKLKQAKNLYEFIEWIHDMNKQPEPWGKSFIELDPVAKLHNDVIGIAWRELGKILVDTKER